MKFFFFILKSIFIFLVGCSILIDRIPEYEKLADEITDNVAKRLKAQKHLFLIGTGGRMMDDIKMMAMSFQYFQEIDLKQARALLVYVIDEYLSPINSNERIRPFLHEYPFTANHIEIRIWIYQPDGHSLSSDKISYITAIDGVLAYYRYFEETYTLLAVGEETYEEALKALISDQ